MIPGIVASALRSELGDPFFADVVSLLHFDIAPATYYDEKGNTWTAAGNVALSATQVKFGDRSAVFDGNGDHLTASAAALDLNSSIYTLEGWAYLNAANYNPSAGHAGRTIFSSYNAQLSGRILINMSTTGALQFNEQSPSGTTNHQVESAAAAVPQQQWFHWAATRDAVGAGGVIRLFINGVMVGSATGVAARADYPTRFRIGVLDPASGAFANWWLGYQDDFRATKGVCRYTSNFSVPTRAFPDGVIDPHFNRVYLLLDASDKADAAPIVDESRFARAVTAVNQAQILDGQLEFDGTDDWLSIPDSDDWRFYNGTSNLDFTMEFFGVVFDVFGVAANGQSQTLLSQYDAFAPATNQRAWTLTLGPANLGLTLSANGSTTSSVSFTSWTPVLGQAYNITLTREGSTYTLFVDGVEMQTAVDSTIFFNATRPLTVGARNTGASSSADSDDLDGRIAAVRITRGVRYQGDYGVPSLPLPKS